MHLFIARTLFCMVFISSARAEWGLAKPRYGFGSVSRNSLDKKPFDPFFDKSDFVSEVVTVSTTSGLVLGITDEWQGANATKTKVWKYHDIPYAMPPVGERRFKDPEPIQSWTGTWNATLDRQDLMECMQYRHNYGLQNQVVGQEDCLYLTIYSPTTPTPNPELLPVIVFIHGGTFMYGSLHTFEPKDLLIHQRVVFVKINFRLGPFGFLSTGNNVVPGNMGLRDQILALRWIKENIAGFGGDPESITIAGNYAGAASVHFHLMSEKSKGLFHKAISMSGTMLSPWALAERLPDKTRLIAQHVGCGADTAFTSMIACLRTRPATAITDAVQHTLHIYYHPTSPWAPVMDGEFASDPLFPDYPAITIAGSKGTEVPWLVGMSDAYGFNMGIELIRIIKVAKKIDHTFTELAPHILDYDGTMDPFAKLEYGEKIREEYVGGKFPSLCTSLDSCDNFCKMIGDRLFYVDTERSVRWMSQSTSSPVYLYELLATDTSSHYFLLHNYQKDQNRLDNNLNGVQFSDKLQKTMEEDKLVELSNRMWANFARFGKPQLKEAEFWPPVTPESLTYMTITYFSEFFLQENIQELGKRSYWEELPFKEFNRYPVPQEYPIVVRDEEISNKKVQNEPEPFTPGSVPQFKLVVRWKNDTHVPYVENSTAVIDFDLNKLSFKKSDDKSIPRAY